jgi:hypothetical protein
MGIKDENYNKSKVFSMNRIKVISNIIVVLIPLAGVVSVVGIDLLTRG